MDPIVFICQHPWIVYVILVGFYGLVYYATGLYITLAMLTLHASLPILFKYRKGVRYRMIFFNFVQWPPFINLKDPSKFGLKGARNITIRHDSTVDDCSIDLGVWHILSSSSHKKREREIESATCVEDIDRIFDEELKTSKSPVVLYLHGVTQTRALHHRVDMYKILQSQDVHVIAFDYRGFADSTNVLPTKKGMVEDSLMVYAWIKNTCGRDHPLFVWGHSIGSGISSKLLSKLEEYSTKYLDSEEPLPAPAGLVLEATFDNVQTLFSEFPVSLLFSWLPYFNMTVRQALEEDSNVRIVPGKYANRLQHLPVLQMHSENDEVIPYKFGQLMRSKIVECREVSDPPATFISFKTGGHMWLCKQATLPKLIGDFIAKHK